MEKNTKKFQMIGFGDRINALCKDRGITIKQLERELGIANGYVRHVEVRGTTPSIERIDLFANYFGVSRDYIVGKEIQTTPAQASTGVLIPLVGRVAAGLPITAVENVIGQEEISKKLAATGEFFALRIKGDSMSPDIHDGDIVVVRQQEDAETGDVVIAIINGDDGVCKELKKTADAVMLISRNPAYPPMVFTHTEIDTTPVRIIGKVVELRRGF